MFALPAAAKAMSEIKPPIIETPVAQNPIEDVSEELIERQEWVLMCSVSMATCCEIHDVRKITASPSMKPYLADS